LLLYSNNLFLKYELTLADGKSARITNIEKITPKDKFKVYNLETENYHDFIVNGVIVHNSNEPIIDNIPFNSEVTRRARAANLFGGEEYLNSPALREGAGGKTNWEVFNEAHNIDDLQSKYNFLANKGYSKETIKSLFNSAVCGKVLPGKGIGAPYAELSRIQNSKSIVLNKVNLELRNNQIYKNGKVMQGVVINGDYIEFIGYHFTNEKAAGEIMGSMQFLRKNMQDPYVYFAEAWDYCQIPQSEIRHLFGASSATDYLVVKIKYPINRTGLVLNQTSHLILLLMEM